MRDTPDPDEVDLDSKLLARWRDGDSAAIGELLANLQPWLRREMGLALAERRRGASDSLDLAQTAVLEFLRWGPKFVPETPAQFKALLKRIGLNGLIDEQRRAELRERGGHLESLTKSAAAFSSFAPAQRSSLTPSRDAQRAEEIEWVRLALQFLTPDERFLLVASEVDGVDWATIAKALELPSADTARVRCTRLKPRVARLLIQLRRGRLPADV